MKSLPVCLGTVRKSDHECGSKTGQGSWQWLSSAHSREKMCLFILPRFGWLIGKYPESLEAIGQNQPSLWTKNQVTKQQRISKEILRSWHGPGLMSQDRKIDFTEECSLVTFLEVCQQWVNLLEDFSPYSSWWKRIVLLSLYFWGKNTAETELPKPILKRGWLRQQIKSYLQSSRLGTLSILVLPTKYRPQKYGMHLSFHTLDSKHHVFCPVPMV